MIKKIVSLVFCSSLLFSCSSSDDSKENIVGGNKFDDGVFITNEGNFMSSNATISYITEDLSSIYNQIFKNANNGQGVGDVAQSIAFNEDLAFVVVNNSNVIEVVNKETFKKIHTITEQMSSPRYALVKNDKIFVTHMYANKVTVYNLSDFSFITSIDLSFQPEMIVEQNDKIYVSSNYYASTNAIAIINPSNNSLINTLAVDLPINGLTQGNNSVYALGTSDSESKIYTIDAQGTIISNTIDVVNARYLEFDLNNLYFTSNLKVYKTSPTIQNTTQLFSVTDNSWSSLYGFEVFDGKIYTSDAKGFTEDGVVTIYSENGSVIKTFRSGLGTNGFFKD